MPSKEWELPSDEEVKTFVLQTGGGYGYYDWSSGVFEVDPITSFAGGLHAAARSADTFVRSRSFNLSFSSAEGLPMRLRVSVALRSAHFEIEVDRIFCVQDKENVTAVKSKHDDDSNAIWSWEFDVAGMDRSGFASIKGSMDKKYRLRLKLKDSSKQAAQGNKHLLDEFLNSKDKLIVAVEREPDLPGELPLAQETTFELPSVSSLDSVPENNGLNGNHANPLVGDAAGDSDPNTAVLGSCVVHLSPVREISSPKHAAFAEDLDWDLCQMLNHKLARIKGRAIGCGRLLWESKSFETPRPYVRLKKGVNPHLLRFLVERVWGLSRPNLLITVTGGAQDFALSTQNKDELLQGLTEAAKAVGAWFVTGGTEAGVMKYMGEARADYANHIPLIGIAPWGVVKGRQEMLASASSVARETFLEIEATPYEKAVREYDEGRESIQDLRFAGGMTAKLDENHSHFIFMYDGKTEKFGGEQQLRSEFEACLAEEHDYTIELLKTMVRLNLGWQGLNFKSIQASKINSQKIPAICVCVQGGPGTIATVRQAVTSGTPCLLIKSSGKAADIMADAVSHIRKFRSQVQTSTGNLKEREHFLSDVIEWTLQQFDVKEEPSPEPKHWGQKRPPIPTLKSIGEQNRTAFASFSFKRVSSTAASEGKISAVPGDDGHAIKNIDYSKAPREVVASIEAALRGYHMIPPLKPGQKPESKQWEYLDAEEWHKVLQKQESNMKMMAEVLHATSMTRMCWIFDLDDPNPNATDLDGALLQCVLNSSGDDDNVEKIFERKLLLCVRWDRPDILSKCLKTSNIKRSIQMYHDGLNAAMLEALVEDRVECVQVLMANGASVNEFSLDLTLKEESTPVDRRTRERREQRWYRLMKGAKDSQDSQHVIIMHDELRKKLKSSNSSTGVKDKNGKPLTYLEMSKERRACSMRRDMAGKSVWAAKTNLIRMTRLYDSLLGIDWRYRNGMMGPAMDLFLWSVLMNRHNLAKFLWETVQEPLPMALTACIFYRRMAKLTAVKPEHKEAMMDHAREFEEIAVSVQSLAMEEDMGQAMEALESPVVFWSGLTCFDLAVMGDSKSFVEKCCFYANDKRWSGDMNPYYRMLGLSLEIWVMICAMTGGLIAPFILDFDLPPTSSSVRAPAQRRKTPAGYPNTPFKNPVLKRRFEDYMRANPDPMDTLASEVHSREARRGSETADLGFGDRLRKNIMTDKRDKCSAILKKLSLEPEEYQHLTIHEKKHLWGPGTLSPESTP